MNVHDDDDPPARDHIKCRAPADGPAPAGGTIFEPILPHLEVADRLEGWIARLLPGVHDQPNSAAREAYTDLMHGLADAVDAMRTFERGDNGASTARLQSALGHLRRAQTGEMRLSEGYWPDRSGQ